MLKHNYFIDSSKGILILLVIAGHVLCGSLQDNILCFVIYSFHMPLFLFISGYLIDLRKLQSYSWEGLLSHYYHRILKLWCFAWLIYTAYAIHDTLGWKQLVENVVYPFYHLWYVPSLMCMMCLVYILLQYIRTQRRTFAILGIASLATLLGGCFFRYPDLKRLTYLIYFVLGLYLRNCPIRRIQELISFSKSGGIWHLSPICSVVVPFHKIFS